MKNIYKIGIIVLMLVVILPFLVVVYNLSQPEVCLNCSEGCEYLVNATERTKQYEELNEISKIYVSQKERVDIESLHCIIKFKSGNEAVVTVISNESTWNGTWSYSNSKWTPGSDFHRS